jgi:8-oxo-dGTP pyrophosphatase MutT (NUDIX family)
MMQDYIPYEVYSEVDRTLNGFDVGLTAHGTWGNSAAGILVVTTDFKRILLLQRSAEVLDPGLWGTPGGARKETSQGLEDALVAAVSETREEMDGIPKGWLRSVPYTYRKLGADFTYQTFVLEVDPAEVKRFRPRLNWENSGYRWFSVDELGDVPLHPGVKEVLENYQFGQAAELNQKIYLGRFSYDPSASERAKKFVHKRISEAVTAAKAAVGLNLGSAHLRGTVCTNVTLDKVLQQGTDRFGRDDTFAFDGDVTSAVEWAVIRLVGLRNYRNGVSNKPLMKVEKRLLMHRRQFAAVLTYDSDKLASISSDGMYEFLVPPNKALRDVFYFSLTENRHSG